MKHPLLALLFFACLSPAAHAGEPCPAFEKEITEIEQILDAHEKAAGAAVWEKHASRTQTLTLAQRGVRHDPMEGLRTRVVDSRGAYEEDAIKDAASPLRSDGTKAWALRELARQDGIRKAATGKTTSLAPTGKQGRGGYSPRVYHSQYYMPKTGSRSRPEEATRYADAYR